MKVVWAVPRGRGAGNSPLLPGDSHAAIGNEDQASDDYTKLIIHTSTIHPKRLSVARSMLMPATPLDFLTRE